MESNETDFNSVGVNVSGDESQALNATILEYYRKFGRKRDLEQFFSLSTAQGDIKDPSSLFWRRMKAQNSSDSGERSKDSSLEVCRISIKCSVPDTDPGSSQEDNSKTKDSDSPPIIIEELPGDITRHSDNESVKSDGNHSQQSMDAILDTSTNKALSPTSSITSQRRLEWDSLADVGYANESDRMNSASNLSTLERLALNQQYSNNDSKQHGMGLPTAHSTPVDENDSKSKVKKGSKTTKIYRRDVDLVEVNMPHSSDANMKSINVNLTKHISFNVEKDGGVSVDCVKRDLSVSPKKVAVETEMTPQMRFDKQIQTSLVKTKDHSVEATTGLPLYGQTVPVLINLNTLKKRKRRKKLKTVRKRYRIKKKTDENKENLPVHEKSGEQVSEAESFEYMPGHIYNQNQMNQDPLMPNAPDNKSSLESSGVVTTDSSKDSKHSFSKDLEKSIKLLKAALHKRYNDSELKQRLIKDVVQRLLQNTYRDDETTTEFLSGLSYSSKKLGLREENTTTSTSDANNTAEKIKSRPKKSILRGDKFNPSVIPSTSQSAPNLPSVSNSEKPVSSSLKGIISSHTESDVSSKDKTSDTAFAKTSSEELYQKYLDALRREEAYKRHLRDKEMFLKQKLVCSDNTFNIPAQLDPKSKLKLKELIKDLTRNNYDDGSGDASKLEGGLNTNPDLRPPVPRSQRSHSVFTLSSGNTENRRVPKKSETKDLAQAGHSKDANHYCCCPHHYANKLAVSDSSVQVNIQGDNAKSQKYEQECACNKKSNVATSNMSCEKHVNECRCYKESNTAPPKISSQKPEKECNCNKKVDAVMSNVSNQRPEKECACKKSNVSSPRAITRIASDNTGDIKYVCLCNNDVKSQETSENLLIYKCSRLTNRSVQSQVMSHGPESSRKSGSLTAPVITGAGTAKACKCSQTNLQTKYPGAAEDAKETICIHEAIRCIQTDISIDPKISDPSLTDIKIISHPDCVKLIREQYREVSKSAISDSTQPDPKIDKTGRDEVFDDAVTIYSSSSKRVKAQPTDNKQTVTTGVQFDCNMLRTVNEEQVIEKTSGDNFMIPIQGTNMTLKLSVGSSCAKPPVISHNSVQVDAASIIDEDIFEKENTNKITKASASTYPPKSGYRTEKSDKVVKTSKLVETATQMEETTDHQFTNPNKKAFDQTDDNELPNSNMNFDNIRLARGYNINPIDNDSLIEVSRYVVARNTDTQISDKNNPVSITVKHMNIREKGYNPTSNTKTTDSTQSVEIPVLDLARCIEETPRQKDMVNYTIHKQNIDVKSPKEQHDNLKENSARITKQAEKSSNAMLTDEISTADNATSLTEECSKGVQSPNDSIFEQYDRGSNLVNTIFTREGVSTIPKKTSKIPKKLMLRSNTNPEILDKGCDTQNDLLDDIKAMKSIPAETKTEQKEIKSQISERKNFKSNTYPKNQYPTEEKASDKTKIALKSPRHESSATDAFEVISKKDMLPENLESSESLVMITEDGEIRTVCGCSSSALCRGFCPEDALCRDFESDPFTEQTPNPSSGDDPISEKGKSEDLTSDNPLLALNKGHPCRPKKLRAGSPRIEVRNTEEPKKQEPEKSEPPAKSCCKSPRTKSPKRSCACPSYAKCEGKCSETAACVLKAKELQKEYNLTKEGASKDIIMSVIQDITNRYSKKNIEKSQRKKCFKEVISILSYLLDTEDNTDTDTAKMIKGVLTDSTSSDYSAPKKSHEQQILDACEGKQGDSRMSSPNESDGPVKQMRSVGSLTIPVECCCNNKKLGCQCDKKKYVDKGVQQCTKKSKSFRCYTESSDIPISTDLPCTSSDSATCKVLNKIRKECEKYHQKRCKSHTGSKKCECSSTTSVSCNDCKRVHYCLCRSHKCKGHKSRTVCDKKKKCVAYNLIIQTSDSMISEEQPCNKSCRPLKNIIVKVPPKRKCENIGCNMEKQLPFCSPRAVGKGQRSRSLPNESHLSSADDGVHTTVYTVREYLERNRPDFVDQCTQRQNCLKMISETRANERAIKRKLLSMQVQVGESTLRALSSADLRDLARELGLNMRLKTVPTKFISERDMKQHSEKIYKTLPEVVQKKEDLKRENIKKTNLLMANIFKKSLQKKALHGNVNLSNYSPVVKI